MTERTFPDSPPVVRGAPWFLRCARFLQRRGWRGGYRILDRAERRGDLERIVRYPIGNGVTLDVPLYREVNRWDAIDVRVYDRDVIRELERITATFPSPLGFVDCGADIGLLSASAVAAIPRIDHVLAIEPNPEAFRILAGNLDRLPVPAEAMLAAVSDFSGVGELRTPSYNVTDHAKYLVPQPGGDVTVVRLDDLALPLVRSLVLKIDVEGAEAAVIRGARKTLARVSCFVVTFEAHPEVAERTGIDPVECLRLIQDIASVHAYPSSAPQLHLTTNQGFFDQVPRRVPYNVICVTT